MLGVQMVFEAQESEISGILEMQTSPNPHMLGRIKCL